MIFRNQVRSSEFTVDIERSETKMLLVENSIKLNNISIREIWWLLAKHQTSVITTNKKLSLESVAVHMFARWTQDNFFKYMQQDYDFDRLLQSAVKQINGGESGVQ